MADNPLLDKAPTKRGKVTTDMLHNLAADLNSEWWVQHMGRRYGVSTDANGKNYLSWTHVRG